jgi:hypothetical protein
MPHPNPPIGERQGISPDSSMSQGIDQFKLILVCLHPDGDRSPEKRADAFQLFNAKRFALTGEVDKKNGMTGG